MLLFLKSITNDYKRIFFWYCILTTVLIISVVLLLNLVSDKTAYFIVARVHTAIEFPLLVYIFSLTYQNKKIKKLSRFAIIPFFILCIYDYIFSTVPSIAYKPLLTECIFFILAIIYFFFEKMKQEAEESFFQTFIFWFAVAFLINFSGNFLLFVYSETSIKNADFKVNYTIIYSAVTILKNLLLCVAATMKDTPVKKNRNNFPDNLEPPIYNKGRLTND